MRNFLYSFGLTALILLNATVVMASGDAYYINREDIEMTEQEYNNLLGLGFTENQIYLMDYQTFIDNKDIQATLVSENSKYIKTTVTIRNGITSYSNQVVTGEEAMAAVANQNLHPMQSLQPIYTPNTSGTYYDGMSADYYNLLVTRIANIDDDTMRYKLDVEWLNMPSVRSWDILAIGIESSKVQMGSYPVHRQDWMTPNYEFGYSTSHTVKMESTGGSIMYPLASDNFATLKAYLYFEVDKQPNVGTITYLIAAGDMAHAITTVDPDEAYYDYSVNYITGIEIGQDYTNSYANMLQADASFDGTW